MSITLQYNPEKKILYITIIDKLSSSEFADALEKVTHPDDFPPDAGILLDTSSINVPTGNLQFNLDSIEIRKRLLEREKSKIAIVTSNDFTFGMGGKYEMLSDTLPQNLMIFDNFIEAEAWLAEMEEIL